MILGCFTHDIRNLHHYLVALSYITNTVLSHVLCKLAFMFMSGNGLFVLYECVQILMHAITYVCFVIILTLCMHAYNFEMFAKHSSTTKEDVTVQLTSTLSAD